ncbi:MAG: hypothetical protein K6F95_10075 [Selenomonas sp.]|uniref:hypothetical protein n=1 Tax=Selenomonas sp. TaxID=2053611 RepID=UPI0025D019EC|nr:hypothetical protein [Selenomonas sp.]MCR5758235.1 hypothetical protein [Selenomonas sp.]
MKKELPHFSVGSAYGGSQEWCPTRWMNIGGCAAITACDCSLYLELYKGMTGLYPHDKTAVSKADYVDFAYVMEPYLKPRKTGIDRLDIYIDGYTKFLQERGSASLALNPWDGHKSLTATKNIIRQQIDEGWPIPCLTLLHNHPDMEDYVWHWYILNGYETFGDTMMVKTVTYGTWRWFDLDILWHTGHERKGGLILFSSTAE